MSRTGFLILMAWLGLTLYIAERAPAPAAWTAWAPDVCRLANCYCEPLRADRLVAQPAATYSNLGFLAAAALILWASLKRGSGDTPGRFHGLTYAAALAGTGLFSGFYHASLTRIGDFLDLMGVYLFTGFLAVYSLHRLRPLRPGVFAGLYAALLLALAAGLRLAYGLQHIYIIALVAAILVLEAAAARAGRPALDRRWLAAALGLFVAGAAVWLLDGRVLPCWPAAPLSWHALWHLCAAGAAGLMFVYYASGRTATASA